MERREPGRTTNAPGHGRLLLWTLGYTLAAFVLLSIQGDASAAQLVDVRVGEHKGYTRLVLELDSLAAYQVSEPREDGDPVMRVELDARGSAQELTPSHAIVKGVRVESIGKDTAIYVHLAKAEVQINEMILLSPPRLVFDIRDPAFAVAKRAAKPVVAAVVAAKPSAARKPAPSAKAVPPTTLKPTAAAPRSPQAAPARGPAVAAAQAKPIKPLPSTPIAIPAPAAAAKPEDAGPLDTDSAPSSADATSATDDGVSEAPGHPLALDGAATGRPNAMAMPAARAGAPAAAGSSGKLAVPPLPSQRRAAAARPEVPASSGGGGVVAKAKGFVGGINKMILAGVGAVVALLLFFVIRRGRVGHDALSPVMAADHLGGDADDLFGGPDESGATEPVPTARSGAPAAAPQPRPSAPPSPAAAGSNGSLESRVAQLENTLMQLAQARENMERQLAAQTEELRVQRAAIARTQRVVRSFGDGDEDSSGATEPVPRVPAS